MIAAHITTHSITVQYISLLLCVSPSWLHTVSSVSNDYCTHSTHNYNTWYTFTTQSTHCASVQHNTTITTQCTSIQHNTVYIYTTQYTPFQNSAHYTIHTIWTQRTSLQHNTHHFNTLHIYTTQYTPFEHTAHLHNTIHSITTHRFTTKCTTLQHTACHHNPGQIFTMQYTPLQHSKMHSITAQFTLIQLSTRELNLPSWSTDKAKGNRRRCMNPLTWQCPL